MLTRPALLVFAAFLLGTAPDDGAHPSPGRARTDLDALDDRALLQDLRAEIAEIFEDGAPDEEVSLDELYDEVMDALADADEDGDEDEGLEAEIALQDLRDEMEEANTSLEAVVRSALGMPAGDAGDGPPHARAAGGPSGSDMSSSSSLPPRRWGASRVEQGLFRTIRAAR